ncbi:MAG: UDP-N-acetylmuramate--L-alanine ligase [bacterium]|nr:UDP-N-acetylmuramate--L-alanine ligase [bacterium]
MYNPNLHFHFTGIGGVGMSGIAEVLLRQGFKVSGSDITQNESCKRLERLGAVIKVGHARENLPKAASLLVYSSAVKAENPELVEAHERQIPVIPRAQVLAELMRLKHGIAVAGSHGKTTTTSFIAHILDFAELDPTVVIGGQVKSMGGSGGKLGKGNFLVAESDESDRSFLLLRPTIAVVTNIDSEHLESYSSMAELEESFLKFAESVPFYGLAVLCLDDPRLQKISENYSKRKVTYGLTPDADITAKNIKAGVGFMTYEVWKAGQLLAPVTLPMMGIHMVSNSLAAIAVALELDVKIELIVESLQSFPGVGRRLETIGEIGGITIVSDYGHHPTEIRATIAALRGSVGADKKIYVVFQPHRFSRTKSCFVDFLNAFNECDDLTISEIYPAGESPIEGVTGEALYKAMNHHSKHFVSDIKDCRTISKFLKRGDVVLCLGAGSVGMLPFKLMEDLESGNFEVKSDATKAA